MKKKITFTTVRNIDLRRLSGNILSIDDKAYLIPNNLLDKTNEELASNALSSNPRVKLIPIKLQHIPGYKPFEKSRMYAEVMPRILIKKYRTASHQELGKYFKTDNLPESKLFIGICWLSMDGTLWEMDEETRIFHPIPRTLMIEFPEHMREYYDFSIIENRAKKLSCVVKIEWYKHHCLDCGGTALQLFVRERDDNPLEFGTGICTSAFFISRYIPEAMKD